ncbi:hypothetical protein K0M31_013059 [Melipona bicolor]|uniref:Uncharacterized protein n=1 Tax=Melipona bicolor TaxID=60889 RepID=A0AA40FIU7_9HYME|nr:hypothetical protein K0M31_013059 [Melipona bicolor]
MSLPQAPTPPPPPSPPPPPPPPPAAATAARHSIQQPTPSKKSETVRSVVVYATGERGVVGARLDR